MIAAGATALRINTSHLSVEELDEWMGDVESISLRQTIATDGAGSLPIVLDLQGSKWRLGECGSLTLSKGERVLLVHSSASSKTGELPVPHADFFRAAAVSDGTLFLNDAKVMLDVERSEPDRLEAVVTRGGEITSFKGITFRRSKFRTESLGEKDAQIIARNKGLPFVRYALSYVKDAEEMHNYRSAIGTESYLIAKLERPEALEQAGEIARVADELWLCRGDLGAELGFVDMAQAAHELSKRVASLGVPVMLAGQVLEHMTEHEAPTRAEVCSLYDALHAGYRGIVLSDETAIGRDPIESCRAAALFR
jgi:pyruvate kinase